MNDIERKHAIAERFIELLEDFKSIDKSTALHFRNSDIEDLGKMIKPVHDRLQEIKKKNTSLGSEIDAKTKARAYKK